MDTLHLQRTPRTGRAASACLHGIEQAGGTRQTPLLAMRELIGALQRDPASKDQFWLIDDRAERDQATTAISAWPLWFSEHAREDERPLFYLTRSRTSAHLSMLAAQTAERGIILNDIESSPSRWAKGAHPWLPLWLAANRRCLPFDPACAEEARAIVGGALREFYQEGRPGFCYLTLHDAPGEPLDCAREQAWLCMYRVSGPSAGMAQVRLLGAGRMLEEVRAAAVQLKRGWGIDSEVWSCPSYTRLARDAAVVRRWNRNPRHVPRRAHLHDCLAGSQAPVIAVTGYAEFVAAQLAAQVEAPFISLGADSLAPGQRLERNWIAYSALQALVAQGSLATADLREALRRYGFS